MRLENISWIVVPTLGSFLVWATSATAAVVVLQAGAAGAPSVVFEIDQTRDPKQIGFRTKQAGVAGSVLDVVIDGHPKPVLHHMFTVDECRFVEQQSRCEVSFAMRSDEFMELVKGFIRGRQARITIADAGVMKMDHLVSLKGVARRIRR
jgi:hypothetical protein